VEESAAQCRADLVSEGSALGRRRRIITAAPAN
jgi:hypothetical protein